MCNVLKIPFCTNKSVWFTRNSLLSGHFDLSIFTNIPDPGLEHDVILCHTDQIIGSSTDNFTNQTSVKVLYQLINIEDFTLDIVLSKVLPVKFVQFPTNSNSLW